MKSVFDPTFQNNDSSSRIVYALERLSQLFRVNLWQENKKNSLSPLQIQILLHLKFQPIERRTVSALAQEFNMARATISDAVKTLDKKGYVVKEENPYDARSFILDLTEEGSTAAQDSSMFANVLRQHVFDLPDHEREVMLKVLLDLLYQLQLSGHISTQRMCYACQHFQKQPDKDSPHYCNLLEKPLMTEDLRVNCLQSEPTM